MLTGTSFAPGQAGIVTVEDQAQNRSTGGVFTADSTGSFTIALTIGQLLPGPITITAGTDGPTPTTFTSTQLTLRDPSVYVSPRVLPGGSIYIEASDFASDQLSFYLDDSTTPLGTFQGGGQLSWDTRFYSLGLPADLAPGPHTLTVARTWLTQVPIAVNDVPFVVDTPTMLVSRPDVGTVRLTVSGYAIGDTITFGYTSNLVSHDLGLTGIVQVSGVSGNNFLSVVTIDVPTSQLPAGPVLFTAVSQSSGNAASASTNINPAVLETGTALLPGQMLTPSDTYRLVMQGDGNLVLYNASNKALWNSGTFNNPGAYLVNQEDGNVVVYSASGRPLWFSGKFTAAPTTLVMQGDGNLVQYAGAVALWNTGTFQTPPPPSGAAFLDPGQTLFNGQVLTSQSGVYVFAVQSDGNLVVYQSGHPIWWSSTFGIGYSLAMQGDGNLVLYVRRYLAPDQVFFNTGTFNNPGAYLVMQDDGNLVIYSAFGKPLWWTKH